MGIQNRTFNYNDPELKIKELETMIDKLRNAMTYIIDANQMVTDVLNDTEYEDHYKAYGQYGFDQLMGNGGRYDNSIYDIIGNLRKEIQELQNEIKNELKK